MASILKDLKGDPRIERLAKLPESLQLESCLDWKTTTAMCGGHDVEHTRRIFREANAPLVHFSERIKLPKVRTVLALLASRERVG